MENQAKTAKAKHSFLVKVKAKRGNKKEEHIFNTSLSTVSDVKKNLEGWFYATHQRVQIVSINKLN